jgi:hypothetical protein
MERRIDEVMAALSAFKSDIDEAFGTMRTLNEVQFGHMDANVTQLREDQRKAQEDIIYVVKELLGVHVTSIKESQARQDERIADLHESVNAKLTYMDAKIDKHAVRVADVAKRVETLEDEPVKENAAKWKETASRVLWAFIGLLLAGGTAGVYQLLEMLKGAL